MPSILYCASLRDQNTRAPGVEMAGPELPEDQRKKFQAQVKESSAAAAVAAMTTSLHHRKSVAGAVMPSRSRSGLLEPTESPAIRVPSHGRPNYR
jgi:hypothetical protein